MTSSSRKFTFDHVDVFFIELISFSLCLMNFQEEVWTGLENLNFGLNIWEKKNNWRGLCDCPCMNYTLVQDSGQWCSEYSEQPLVHVMTLVPSSMIDALLFTCTQVNWGLSWPIVLGRHCVVWVLVSIEQGQNSLICLCVALKFKIGSTLFKLAAKAVKKFQKTNCVHHVQHPPIFVYNQQPR